jgi:predicted DNA-binding transcriptional regulator YafY
MYAGGVAGKDGGRQVRASRLINALLLLQNRGTMTARELADALEVSVRTVHRDVEALAEAGIPVLAERGAAGGFRLMEGYRTRLTGLTASEADALLLAGLPGPASELGLGEVVATAQLKLFAALPAAQRERAERLRQRFLLDPGGWFQQPVDLPWLTTLADAVWTQRPIRITYQRWGKTDIIVTRELDPLGLVLKAGVWYLIAAPEGRPRMYRVSKVLGLTVREGTFEPPTGFDLEEAWRGCARDFESRIYVETMTVRISREGLGRIQAFLSPFQVEAIRASRGDNDSDWVTVDVPVQSQDHAVWDVLKMAPHMAVLAPAPLRQRVHEVATRLAALHEA